MWFYAKLRFIKKFSYKLLFIAFIGSNIPLIGLLLYVVGTPASNYTGAEIVIATLFFTLTGTALTLYFLNRLLTPLRISQIGLETYVKKGKLPNLPTHYTDEAGLLMAQIQHTIEKLDEIIEDKKDLLALASHDLRSPATQIQGLLQLMRADNSPGALEQYCNLIDDLCAKQLNLLENLITLLRTNESAISSEHMEKTCIKDILEICITMNRVLINAKEIKIEMDLPNDPVYISAEKILLTQAIQNLLNNAVKYSQKGETITISLKSDPGYAKLIIKDNGLGFDPDSAVSLFDKFTLERKKGTSKESTTGLGLYLSKKIITQHSGDIVAHSEGKDKGATFTVTLPT